MENQLPIAVFDFKKPGNIQAILQGKRIGTFVRGE
jgi:uridylate kinase